MKPIQLVKSACKIDVLQICGGGGSISLWYLKDDIVYGGGYLSLSGTTKTTSYGGGIGMVKAASIHFNYII